MIDDGQIELVRERVVERGSEGHGGQTAGVAGAVRVGAREIAVAEALGDRSWWVRKNAMDALVRLGEPARPSLVRALNSDDRFARDCAIEALTVMGVPVAAAPRTGTAA